MDANKLAVDILKCVGGEDNVDRVYNCSTRIRFYLKDRDKADTKAVESLEGVHGVSANKSQYQVIIGPEAATVYDALANYIEVNGNEEDDFSANEGREENSVGKKKLTLKGLGSALLDTISGCFSQAMPAIIGCGTAKSIVLLLTTAGIIDAASETGVILNGITDIGFYFLPVILGLAAAKQFKVNEIMALTVTLGLISPFLISAAAEGTEWMHLFGIPMWVRDYSYSVLPPIATVWVMKYIEKWLNKFCPAVLKAVVVPTLTLVIMVPLMYCVVAPLLNIVAVGFGGVITWFFDHTGFVAGVVYGLVCQVMVSLGLHWCLTPVVLQNLATIGYDTTMCAMSYYTNWAVVGACIAMIFLAKKKTVKENAVTSTIIAAACGITEPAIFSIFYKYRSALWGATIGGAIGCGLASFLHQVSYGYVYAGIIGFGALMSPDNSRPNNFVFGLICMTVSTIAAIIVTSFLEKRRQKKEENK